MFNKDTWLRASKFWQIALGLTLTAGTLGIAAPVDAQSCAPDVVYYPVRAPHNHGYDASHATRTCGPENSNSDFYSQHIGNDVWAERGAPVVSPTDGVVELMGWRDYSGRHVGIRDKCGWVHWFIHLEAIAPGFSTGDRIEAGTLIGTVGDSGAGANGVVHLHMSVYPAGGGGNGLAYYNNGIDPHPVYLPVENDVCFMPCVGQTCIEDRLNQQAHIYAPARTTDVDGDGRADVCARASDGLRCALAQADGGFGESTMLLPLTNASGWDDATNYATMRMGDIDGDGRADLCARANAGIRCWTSETTPLGTSVQGPEWSDASGWDATQYYSTIRLVDLNGDGRDDLCARASTGVVCHLSTSSGFGPAIEGPAWSDSAGFAKAQYYGTLRAGDVNGDGKEDLCIRGEAGMFCALSNSDGFDSELIPGPAWNDEGGWDDPMYWSTIKLADVNGDGMADLCVRRRIGLVCHFSTGTGFGEQIVVAELSNDSGWDDPSKYHTLRTADIDGDGADDLCIRSASAVLCYLWDGTTFRRVDGPAWSDANGWHDPSHYETLRLGDVNGDGNADLCARAGAGWLCAPSTGNGFGDAATSTFLANDAGWLQRPYFDTIMFGSTVPEPQPEPVDPGDTGTVTAPDGGSEPDPGKTPDAGFDSGETGPDPDPIEGTGCGSVNGAANGTGGLLALGILGLLARRRR